MSTYQEIANGVDFGLTPQPQPQLSGALLHIAEGTVWMVVNGLAKGYTSWDSLMKLHNNFPFVGPENLDQPWLQRRVFGDRQAAAGFDIKRYFTEIKSINFIKQDHHWSQNAELVMCPDCGLAIYDRDVLYGVPSQKMAKIYKLAENKAKRITPQEFRSYPMIMLQEPVQ